MIIEKCPFCGSMAALTTRYNYRCCASNVFVECTSCGAQGASFISDTNPAKEKWRNTACLDAIEAWNKRTYNF